MENENKELPMKEAFNQNAKARLRELRAMTRVTTRELGLPPAAEPDVLATLYGGEVKEAVEQSMTSRPEEQS